MEKMRLLSSLVFNELYNFISLFRRRLIFLQQRASRLLDKKIVKKTVQ